MPSLSLWLVPPSESPLTAAITRIITQTLPARFPNLALPSFHPHVTLASNIPSENVKDPQQFLDNLKVPRAGDVRVCFEGLEVGQEYFKKVTIRVADDGVKALARECRAMGVKGGDEKKAEDWVVNEYQPHCSLL